MEFRSFKSLQREVYRRVPMDTMTEVLGSGILHGLKLWGTARPRDMEKKFVFAAIYKDAYHLSYKSLMSCCRHILPSYSSKTWRHNVRAVRKLLRKWGKRIITPGSSDDWDREKVATLPQKYSSKRNCPNLLIDSFDVRLSGKASIRRKSSSWSY